MNSTVLIVGVSNTDVSLLNLSNSVKYHLGEKGCVSNLEQSSLTDKQVGKETGGEAGCGAN